MRILIAAHGFPPTDVGGAERRAARIARELRERGHDVRVFAIHARVGPQRSPRESDELNDGVPVYRLHLSQHTRLDPAGWEFDNPHTGAAFRSYLVRWRPDIVHVFSGYLLSGSVVQAALEAGLPLVVSLTDYWWMCHRLTLLRASGEQCDGPSPTECARCRAEVFRRYRWPAKILPLLSDRAWDAAGASDRLGNVVGVPTYERRLELLRGLLRRADMCVAPSLHIAQRYVGYGLDPKRIVVQRQGADIRACKLRQPSSTVRIGYIGQVRHHKGVDLLLQAWRLLTGDRPRELRIYGSAAGDRAYERRIRTAVAQARDASWHDEFRGAEVWDILAELDVLVVPSRWAENSPNAIVEAQAVGLPVIGARIGGITDMIDDRQTGLLFIPDDADDLAAKLQAVLDEPQLLAQLTRAYKPFLPVSEEVDHLEGLYQQLV